MDTGLQGGVAACEMEDIRVAGKDADKLVDEPLGILAKL